MHTYVHNANYVFVLSGGRVKNYQPASQDPRMESLREENHPALRQRGLVEPDAKRSVDDVLDDNLDQMAQGLSRLKGLAIDLNAELDDHDEILDRIEDKASHAGIKVNKQNKDMSKLLGGKKKWSYWKLVLGKERFCSGFCYYENVLCLNLWVNVYLCEHLK